MWNMENNRGHDDITSHGDRTSNDVDNERSNQQKNRRNINLNGFEGMNYEQQRERYRLGKRSDTHEDYEDRRKLRRERD